MDDLLDGIVEELEPNAAYYNHRIDGWQRHAPDATVLEFLGVIVTAVVLPILTSVASSELTDRLKRWQNNRAHGKADVEDVLSAVDTAIEPSEDARVRAADAIAAILREHGWPEDAAELDAKRVVIAILRSLRDR